MLIEPIDENQQKKVCKTTADYISKASDIYDIQIETIPVNFDLKGRSAGMYRVREDQRHIRYNPYIFAKYFNNNLATTVPHEVAHYVTDLLYGLRNIKPHGAEWREVMLSFGVEPCATASYDLEGIPVRRSQRYKYQCKCSSHNLSAIRHNRIQHDRAVYFCRHCLSTIKLRKPA